MQFQHGRDGSFLPLFSERHVRHEGRCCWCQQENRAGIEGHEGEGSLHGDRLLPYDRLVHGAARRHQHVERADGFSPRSQVALSVIRPAKSLARQIHLPEVVRPGLRPLRQEQNGEEGGPHLIWDNCPGHKIITNDPQLVINCLNPNVTAAFQLMDMGVLFAFTCQYKTEKVARMADLIDNWDTVRARKILR